MSKIGYQNINPELKDKFNKAITPGNRFTNSRVRHASKILSREKKRKLISKTLLFEVSRSWNELTDEQKENWNNAGAECGLNGWKLYLQDYANRKKYGLSGVAIPSVFHQSLVGKIEITGYGDEIKLIQEHARNYYIKRKVTNKKESFSPVLITEDLSLPFKFSINYKSNLQISGYNPEIRIYTRFWYSYQGENLYYDLDLPISFNRDWTHVEKTLEILKGILISYEIIIFIKDLRGNLFFDNIKAEHSGQNFARDPFCQNIDEKFVGNFYQVKENWKAEIITSGAKFFSTYQDF